MILDHIIESTKNRVARRKRELLLDELKHQVLDRPACLDFRSAMRRPGISVIAEIKRASPSKGVLRADLDPKALASVYAQAGASAISVITEPDFFRGSLADLTAVREILAVPLLRKDFLVDRYQVYEARAFGADAFLLIVAALNQDQLSELLGLGRELGLSGLVEVHTEAEVERALAAGAEIVGINNRNLADFSVDLETTLNLRRLIPNDVVVISESGIHSRQDILRLADADIDAVLIGEALVTSDDPATLLTELLGQKLVRN